MLDEVIVLMGKHELELIIVSSHERPRYESEQAGGRCVSHGSTLQVVLEK